jgi:hypothetical protein
MDTNTRVTKQGVRDLNYYGPRTGKAVAGAPVEGEEEEEERKPRPPTASDETDDGTHFEGERRPSHID